MKQITIWHVFDRQDSDFLSIILHKQKAVKYEILIFLNQMIAITNVQEVHTFCQNSPFAQFPCPLHSGKPGQINDPTSSAIDNSFPSASCNESFFCSSVIHPDFKVSSVSSIQSNEFVSYLMIYILKIVITKTSKQSNRTAIWISLYALKEWWLNLIWINYIAEHLRQDTIDCFLQTVHQKIPRLQK